MGDEPYCEWDPSVCGVSTKQATQAYEQQAANEVAQDSPVYVPPEEAVAVGASPQQAAARNAQAEMSPAETNFLAMCASNRAYCEHLDAAVSTSGALAGAGEIITRLPNDPESLAKTLTCLWLVADLCSTGGTGLLNDAAEARNLDPPYETTYDLAPDPNIRVGGGQLQLQYPYSPNSAGAVVEGYTEEGGNVYDGAIGADIGCNSLYQRLLSCRRTE